MQWYFILLICLGAAAIACALLLFALSAFAYRTAFGARCDKNPLLTYFTAEHFGLEFSPVEVVSGKIPLRGGVYRKGEGENRGLVIFCHGMGAGHAAYMTEIDYFCGRGYAVLALDNRGCDLSGGKNLKGFYAGVDAAKAAYDFAKGDKELKNSKTYFIGHSWGGYSALCAACERKVDGVVALSAPDTPVGALYCGAAAVLPKWLAAAMKPFIGLICLANYGGKGNESAAKCAGKCNAPVLLIHGDSDTTVPVKRSAYAKAEGENITKTLAQNKAHNPYNTVEAQKLMIELTQNLAAARKMNGEQLGYFARFDYAAATREDSAVMDGISAFLQDCAG